MLHPDMMLWLANARLDELRAEAERFRLIRLSRQPEDPLTLPPGLLKLLELKAEKQAAISELEKLVGCIREHAQWRAYRYAQSQAAVTVHDALKLGERLRAEGYADERRLAGDVHLLYTELVVLARIWCALEGTPLPGSEVPVTHKGVKEPLS